MFLHSYLPTATLYLIVGVSLAQLKWFCGLENFIELFRTTLVAVYDLEKDELGEISVFDLNIAGSVFTSDVSYLGRIITTSVILFFYILLMHYVLAFCY